MNGPTTAGITTGGIRVDSNADNAGMCFIGKHSLSRTSGHLAFAVYVSQPFYEAEFYTRFGLLIAPFVISALDTSPFDFVTYRGVRKRY